MSVQDVGELLPDGPLQNIVSLVRDPHRRSLRLVCRKFLALEAATRTSLVFRVPRLRSNPAGTSFVPGSPDSGVSIPPLSLEGTPSVQRRRRTEDPDVACGPSVAASVSCSASLSSSPLEENQADLRTSANLFVREVPSCEAYQSCPGLDVTSAFDAEDKHPKTLDLSSVFSIDDEPPRLSRGGVKRTSSESDLDDAVLEEAPKRQQAESADKAREGKLPTTRNGSSSSQKNAESSAPPVSVPRAYAPLQGYMSDADSCPDPAQRRGFQRNERSGSEALLPSDGEVSEDEIGHSTRCKDLGRVPVPQSSTTLDDIRPGLVTLTASTRTASPTPQRPRSMTPSPSVSSFPIPASVPSPLPTAECTGVAASGTSRHSRLGTPPPAPDASHSTPGPSLFRINVMQQPLMIPTSRLPLPGVLGEEDASTDDGSLPEDRLKILLERFPCLQSLQICDLNPGGYPQDIGPPLDQKLLCLVANQAKGLQELHLIGPMVGCQLSNAGLVALAQGCPALRKLVLHQWAVGREGMAALADAGRALEELELDFFSREQGAGTLRVMTEIARCPSLTSVHLRYCNNEALGVLARGCPRLRRLTLLFSLLGTSFVSLGRHCRDLRELTLRSCDAGPLDDPLAYLAQHCTSLTSISLHAGHAATEPGLLRLVAVCPQLTKLSLEFKPLPIRLENIAEHLSGLRELTLQWVHAEDADLVAISRHCKKLNVLVLSLQQNVTDAGVTSLLEGFGSSLEVLFLRVRDASDAVLDSLGSQCHRLQRLTLGLPQVTTTGLEGMFALGPEGGEGRRLGSLTRLQLWDCTALDGRALDCIARGCPKLEGFGMKGCHGVSDEQLQAFVGCCSKLEHLEVERRYMTPALQDIVCSKGIELVQCSP